MESLKDKITQALPSLDCPFCHAVIKRERATIGIRFLCKAYLVSFNCQNCRVTFEKGIFENEIGESNESSGS